MTEDRSLRDGVSRRRLLAALSGAGTMAVAGCSEGASDPSDPSTAPTSSTETVTETATTTETTTTASATLRLQSLSLSRATVGQFQPATLTATVANTGGTTFDGYAAVDVDDTEVHSRGLSLEPGASTELSSEVTAGVVGDHEVALRALQYPDETRVIRASRTLSVSRYPDAFVGVDGTEFTCGGGSLYLNGSNDQQVVASQVPEERIDRVFRLAADLGMNVMRVFGFGVPWTNQPAQPSPGEYSERFFRRFDRIIAAAKRHGLRLVVPLVNNNNSVDSVSQYVSWVDGASEHNDFYEVEGCRTLYKQYVEHVLTRENSLTGLEYREDPTIMLWELGNELNCRWPKKYPLDWIREMGAHVKSLDDDHLLATGVRGLQWGAGGKQSWRDRITEDTTMVKSNRPAVVDAVSIHFYPDPSMADVEDPAGELRDIIRAGHEVVGKPVYLGEFNWGVRPDEGETVASRNERLSGWFDVAAEERLSCAIVHEISTPEISNLKSGNRGPHSIIPAEDDRTAEILRGHSEWARSTSTSFCPGGTSQ